MTTKRAYSTQLLFGGLVLFAILVLPTNSIAFRVCLDLGHGGDDGGAPTHIPGYSEDSINFQIGQVVLVIWTGWRLD
jgi:N-acetylmuramoyl-L-alanine amidase